MCNCCHFICNTKFSYVCIFARTCSSCGISANLFEDKKQLANYEFLYKYGLSLPCAYSAADWVLFVRLSSPRSIVDMARLDALQLAFLNCLLLNVFGQRILLMTIIIFVYCACHVHTQPYSTNQYASSFIMYS